TSAELRDVAHAVIDVVDIDGRAPMRRSFRVARAVRDAHDAAERRSFPFPEEEFAVVVPRFRRPWRDGAVELLRTFDVGGREVVPDETADLHATLGAGVRQIVSRGACWRKKGERLSSIERLS